MIRKINLQEIIDTEEFEDIEDLINVLRGKINFISSELKKRNIILPDDYFKISIEGLEGVSTECILNINDKIMKINYNKSNKVYCIHRKYYEKICPIIEVLSEKEFGLFKEMDDSEKDYDYTIFTNVEELKASNLYITSEHDFNKFIKIIEYSFKGE